MEVEKKIEYEMYSEGVELNNGYVFRLYKDGHGEFRDERNGVQSRLEENEVQAMVHFVNGRGTYIMAHKEQSA